MVKYDNKIKKEKENKEPFDLEKYIDDIEFLRFLEKERIERMIRLQLQRKPEIRVKVVKLDTSIDSELLKRLGTTIKPRKENKMKIEWIE